MIKIRRHKKRTVPMLNMTSMPDLIFTVLFFFMIVTHMRTETPQVKVTEPDGKELDKTPHSRQVVNLYVGKDNKGQMIMQLGQSMVTLEQLGNAVAQMREGKDDDIDSPIPFTINIRADKNTPMGIITDIKQELRKVDALTIKYEGVEP